MKKISGYLNIPFDFQMLNEGIRKASQIIRQHNIDTIIMTGVSGFSFGFPLVYHLNLTRIPDEEKECHPIVIRKTLDNTHGLYYIENDRLTHQKAFIVDDFISSGATIKSILTRIKESSGCQIQIEGIILYDQHVKLGSYNNNGAEIPIYII